MTENEFYMKENYPDITGKQYGHLIAISYAGSRANHDYWNCFCTNCNELADHPIAADNLISGKTTSCGCIGKGRKRIYNKYFFMPEYHTVIVFYNDFDGCFADDIENMPMLTKYTWYPQIATDAQGNITRIDPVAYISNKKCIKLSRLKMGIDNPKIEVDHINGNAADCRSCNLRLATKWQNLCNREIKYGQIKYHKKTNTYVLSIVDENGEKQKFSFPAEEKAEAFRCDWLEKHFGQFTYWNSQAIAKKHALYYLDDLSFSVPIGKNSDIFEEVAALRERNVFKIMLRKYSVELMRINEKKESYTEDELFDLRDKVWLKIERLLEDYKTYKTEITD